METDGPAEKQPAESPPWRAPRAHRTSSVTRVFVLEPENPTRTLRGVSPKRTRSPSPRQSPYNSPPSPSSPRIVWTVPRRVQTPAQDLLSGEVAQLVRWTGKFAYRMLYNSRAEDLSARQLNARIGGQENVMFIVSTDEELFGCYYPTDVPVVEGQGAKVECPSGHFVFSMRHALHSPFRAPAKQGAGGFTMHPAADTDIVLTTAGFWVKTDGRLFVYHSAADRYRLPSTVTNPFTRTTVPYSSEIKGLAAFEWF